MGYRLVLLTLLFGGLAARWATKPRRTEAASRQHDIADAASAGAAADSASPNAGEQAMQAQQRGAGAGVGAALPAHGREASLLPGGPASSERPDEPSPGLSDFSRGA